MLIRDILAGVFILGGMGLVILMGIVGVLKTIRESKNINENE
jgi:hypothetical protein